jgi:phospholipid/cholesterol/gamma-HCH transport system substrate-binding protein
MSKRYLAVGIFIIGGLTLFAVGIFMVGNRHEAFSQHVLLYTEFSDLDGVAKGSKVQVAGMDAGQVTKIDVPRSPTGRFRVQMRIDEQLAGLVRTDSFVTVDTEGVVGNTFLTVHPGSPATPIARADSILSSRAPVSIADLLSHGLIVMNDADSTLKQLGGKMDVALDGVNGAVGNANDLLTGLKEGRGTAGMLLRDERVAAQIRETMLNVQSTTANLHRASSQVSGIIADVQQRELPQKLDDTMKQISSASSQADAMIGQVRQSLAQALGPDANGVTAAQNIQETLTNINAATGNMAEDTEALKHNLFFKGFFDRRGYYTLSNLSPQEYRRSKLFGDTHSPRAWLQATALFQDNPNGGEALSSEGKRSLDAVVASMGDTVFKNPIVIEGYSDAAVPADALSRSYARAQLVRNYLEARYPFVAKNVGVMPLSGTPPPGMEQDHWSGVCIMIAEKK